MAIEHLSTNLTFCNMMVKTGKLGTMWELFSPPRWPTQLRVPV